MHSSLLISVLLLVPLIGAGVSILVKKSPDASYFVGLVTAIIELVLAVLVAVLYNPHIKGAQAFDFYYRHVISAPLGLAYDVAIDGISVFLVVLAALVTLMALWGARDKRRESSFVSWLLVLTSFTIGSFVSHDFLEFFVFFELILIPTYFLISQWGGARGGAAATKFFVYTFTGSAFLFIAILYLGFAHQHQTTGALTFAYGALSQTAMTSSTEVWLFLAMAVAFAVKSPIWPFHTWAPESYEQAPTAGSIELSGILAKMGSYGLLRFAVGLLPLAMSDVRPLIMTLAVIGILYGSALACVTPDLKRVVAYSSLAQMGFITLGVVSGSTIATEGAVLMMFNHGVITMGFFLLISYIEKRRGTYVIADLRGLQGPAPVLAAIFTVVMMASIGLPGLSNFVSEYLILIGTFSVHAWWAVLAGVGVIGAALYWLWSYQRVFHGTSTGENSAIADVSTSERWTLVPVVALVLVLGIFPTPLLNKIGPSVHQLIEHAATASGVTK